MWVFGLNEHLYILLMKYEHWPDDLHFLCFTDFASNYVSKKSGDVPEESDDTKSYTVSVSNIDDIEPNPNIIALKNKHGKMLKHNIPCVICFHKVFKT